MSVPVGTVIVWPVSTPPEEAEKWLECDGRSTAGYPELAAKVGGTVPDYRGYFLRGNGGNSAALGQAQGDAIRNVTGTFDARVAGMWRQGTGPFRVGDSGGQKVAVDGGKFYGCP